MSGNGFIDQYLKKFSDSVQANEEAVKEFKQKIETGTVPPQKIAIELLRKYSGDMNTFFQATELSKVSVGYYGNLIGQIGSLRCTEFERDGRKRYRCVGFLQDRTGRLPFTEFTETPSRLSKGDFVLMVNVNVGEYNGKPYLTISSKNEVDILEKSTLRSVSGEMMKIKDIGPDMYDVHTKGSLKTMGSRENVGNDSVTLYTGILSDDSGTISVQSWGIPLSDGSVEIDGASVKQFREKLYLQIGKGTKITVIEEEREDFSNLEQLSGSQKGSVEGEGIVLNILDSNPVVSVCSVCQKIVKDSKCKNHPDAPVEKIMRISVVIDDGFGSQVVYVYQKILENFVDGGKDRIKKSIEENDLTLLLKEIREKLKFRFVKFSLSGFRGTSGMYLEAQDISILSDRDTEERFQKILEEMK